MIIVNNCIDKCCITFPFYGSDHKDVSYMLLSYDSYRTGNNVAHIKTAIRQYGFSDICVYNDEHYLYDHYHYNYSKNLSASTMLLSIVSQRSIRSDGRLEFNLWRITGDELIMVRKILKDVFCHETWSSIASQGLLSIVEFAIDMAVPEEDANRYFAYSSRCRKFIPKYDTIYYGNKVLKWYDKTPGVFNDSAWSFLGASPTLGYKIFRVEKTLKKYGLSPKQFVDLKHNPFQDVHVIDAHAIKSPYWKNSYQSKINSIGYRDFMNSRRVNPEIIKLVLESGRLNFHRVDSITDDFNASLSRLKILFGSDDYVEKYISETPMHIRNYIHSGFVTDKFITMVKDGMTRSKYKRTMSDLFGSSIYNEIINKPLRRQDAERTLRLMYADV